MPGLKKGLAALPTTGGDDDWLKVKDGETAIVASLEGLDGLISIYQHGLWRPGGSSPVFICIGKVNGCPGCQLGDKAKFKAFLPVKTESGETKVFSFGRQIAQQLAEFENELDGGIKGKRMKIRRQGEGLKTKWSVMVNSVEIDISKAKPVDVEAKLGPQDRDGILDLMREKDFDFDSELVAAKSKSAETDDAAGGKIFMKKDEDGEWGDL